MSEVAAICEQVDRLPLAIELAAMHVKLLSLSELQKRLTSRLALLRDGARDLPERQQTMEDAIAWSYELLTEEQQRCFRALGVFVGGWTLEAATAVATDDPDGELEVLDLLTALVDASLVIVDSGGDGSEVWRYRLLETVRAYGLVKLREAGEEVEARSRHIANALAAETLDSISIRVSRWVQNPGCVLPQVWPVPANHASPTVRLDGGRPRRRDSSRRASRSW